MILTGHHNRMRRSSEQLVGWFGVLFTTDCQATELVVMANKVVSDVVSKCVKWNRATTPTLKSINKISLNLISKKNWRTQNEN